MRKEMMDIGDRIKKVRMKHQLTQSQFAEIIGKSQSTVYGYENNTIIPPFKVLLTISSLFSISVDEIIGLKSNTHSAQDILDIYQLLWGDAFE